MSVRIAAAAIHYMPDKKFFKLGAAQNLLFIADGNAAAEVPSEQFFRLFKSVQFFSFVNSFANFTQQILLLSFVYKKR